MEVLNVLYVPRFEWKEWKYRISTEGVSSQNFNNNLNEHENSKNYLIFTKLKVRLKTRLDEIKQEKQCHAYVPEHWIL